MGKRTISKAIICIMILTLIIEIIPLAARARISIFYSKDWGISYQEDGQQPVGNESNTYLQEYNACYIGDSSQKVIYLTFDSGYENGYTETILDVLKKQEVPATFFLVGHYLKTNPELVKRMVAEGHIVGNHTFSHPDMTIQSFDGFKKELEDYESMYKALTGEEMLKYYRPPAGKYSENSLKYAQELGYKTIFWSLAYLDWNNDKQPSREMALSKTVNRIHPGAIVLLHSTSKTNSEILDELITEWKKQGYTFKSLEDIDF